MSIFGYDHWREPTSQHKRVYDIDSIKKELHTFNKRTSKELIFRYRTFLIKCMDNGINIYQENSLPYASMFSSNKKQEIIDWFEKRQYEHRCRIEEIYKKTTYFIINEGEVNECQAVKGSLHSTHEVISKTITQLEQINSDLVEGSSVLITSGAMQGLQGIVRSITFDQEARKIYQIHGKIGDNGEFSITKLDSEIEEVR